ncbi:unnamed protein product [Closterium sp. NIES-54]
MDPRQTCWRKLCSNPPASFFANTIWHCVAAALLLAKASSMIGVQPVSADFSQPIDVAFFVALRGLRSHFHTSRRELSHGPPRLRVRGSRRRSGLPPDPGIWTSASAAPGTRVSATPGAGEAAALGACASAPPGTESSAALHTFTLDSGASRCFFRDRTALEPLARPVAVSLADPSGGPVIATSSTVLPCPAVPSGTLSGLHLPSFSTNLVAGCALQDGGVHQFTPAYERVTHCTCARTGRHLATFTRQPGSDLYTLTTVPPQVAASASASASGQLSAPCSCRSLAHLTVLWHHRLGHPSVQRLRAMHSRYLVSGLPRVLPTLPPSPAPPCLPCVEGRQRAAPHSSSFPPTIAPLQTLHMDVWGPARVRGQGQERYFLIVVDVYSRYTTVFPLRTKGEVPDVLIPWIRRARLQLSERFHSDFPVLRLHSDRGGEFSSDLLAAYCAEHGIEQSFTLPASPQQNGVAERRIGLVMEVARTSLIHAAAPHFLWPFAVRYTAHQLNLWPRVSLPETSPTLLWTGEVGDASRFRVWGSRAFVRDTSADKLSSRAVPYVFLGFVPDAPGWQFYHATSRRVLPSQDVTFDESVPYYRLFLYRTAPLPPPPLFLAPGAAVVDPLLPQGAAPSGVSQVDPVGPVEVAVDSRPAAGAESGGAVPVGAEPGGAEPGGADSGGAVPGGTEPGGAEPGSAESGGAMPGGAEPWAAAYGGAVPGSPEPGGAESGGPASGGPVPESSTPGGALSSAQLREWYFQYCSLRRGTSGAGRSAGTGTSPPRRELPSRDQLRAWYERRCTLRSGAPGVTDPGAPGTTAGAEDPGAGASAGAVEPGVGAAAGAEDPVAGAAAGAVESSVGAAGAEDPGAGAAAGAGDPGVGAAAGAEDPGVGAAAGAVDPGTGDSAGSGVAARRRPYFVPLLQQVLGLPSSTRPPPLECPQPVPSQLQFQLASPLPAPSPYTGPTGGLAERRESASRPASPVRAARSSGRGSRQRPPPVPGTHRMSLRPSTAPLRAPLPSPPESSLPVLADPESDSLRTASPTVTRLLASVVTDPSFESTAASALVTELVDFAASCRLDYAASLVTESESVCPPSVGGEGALSTDVLEDRQEEFQCLAAASPHLVSVLLTPEGDPDALDIPTPRSYAEAIEGPYSSQWQAAMDAEMASWKSTGTYVDAVPPPGANISFTPFCPCSGSTHVFQLRLAYVASEANTADVFTKALAPCDHQRFCTQLDVPGAEDVGAASVSAKRRSSKGKGRKGGGGGSGSGGGGSSGGGGGSGGGGAASVRDLVAPAASSGVPIFDLDLDAILSAMYALSVSAEGDCYLCVPPDPCIAAAALGASESGTLPGTALAEALHTFMLDSGASRCFFPYNTTLTPLSAPVPVRLADPSGGPVVARSSTVLLCPAVPSGSLSGLHLPSFSTNLVSTAALQDAMVTTTTPKGQRVSICTCTRTGRHLATFTRRPGSSLYTLATEPPQVAASAQVSASGQVAASCSCRLLLHQTLLWHHRQGHPSLPRLHGMHSRLLVFGLPRSLPPLPPSPTSPCLPCVEGWQRAAPHSSSFPPTTAPLQTLHMDVWGQARVSGQGRERYFWLVVDDYTRYTAVFPLRSKGEVIDVLVPWIRAIRLQLRERFCQDAGHRIHALSNEPCAFMGEKRSLKG